MILGIAAFALCIILSIVLHEYGHMRVALWSGMRVRRFFVGFGPTLWSTRRTSRHGETEYGVKAFPLGGFCDIAGMTAYDRLDPADEPKAMWRQSATKRVAVLLAGPVMNIVLGIVLFYLAAVAWGLPNRDVEPIPAASIPAVVGTTACPTPDCTDAGPAGAADIRAGDRITSIDGRPVEHWSDISPAIRELGGRTVPVVVDRRGVPVTTSVTVASVGQGAEAHGALGITLDPEAVPAAVREDPRYQSITHYDALSAVPGVASFTGRMTVETVKGIATFPSKMPGVVRSIMGEQRAQDSPVSVVGASHLGGQAVERHNWLLFVLFLGSLNLFLGGFNLVPLTPFDGGHIAVVCYEKIRDALRRMRGLAPGGPADYEKLGALTMTVLVLLIGISALVIIADVVNPLLL